MAICPRRWPNQNPIETNETKVALSDHFRQSGVSLTLDEFLTAREVAAELRCSKAQVYKLINGQVDGVAALPHLALGPRKKLVPRSGLEAWKRQHIESKIVASEMDTVDVIA